MAMMACCMTGGISSSGTGDRLKLKKYVRSEPSAASTRVTAGGVSSSRDAVPSSSVEPLRATSPSPPTTGSISPATSAPATAMVRASLAAAPNFLLTVVPDTSSRVREDAAAQPQAVGVVVLHGTAGQ